MNNKLTRFAVFVRRARVLPTPCPATRNLWFLRCHRHRHPVVSTCCFTGLVRVLVRLEMVLQLLQTYKSRHDPRMYYDISRTLDVFFLLTWEVLLGSILSTGTCSIFLVLILLEVILLFRIPNRHVWFNVQIFEVIYVYHSSCHVQPTLSHFQRRTQMRERN